MSGLKIQRQGQIMESELCNPTEVEGVMNPAAIRGTDGKLYPFPLLKAKRLIFFLYDKLDNNGAFNAKIYE